MFKLRQSLGRFATIIIVIVLIVLLVVGFVILGDDNSDDNQEISDESGPIPTEIFAALDEGTCSREDNNALLEIVNDESQPIDDRALNAERRIDCYKQQQDWVGALNAARISADLYTEAGQTSKAMDLEDAVQGLQERIDADSRPDPVLPDEEPELLDDIAT